MHPVKNKKINTNTALNCIDNNADTDIVLDMVNPQMLRRPVFPKPAVTKDPGLCTVTPDVMHTPFAGLFLL